MFEVSKHQPGPRPSFLEVLGDPRPGVSPELPSEDPVPPLSLKSGFHSLVPGPARLVEGSGHTFAVALSVGLFPCPYDQCPTFVLPNTYNSLEAGGCWPPALVKCVMIMVQSWNT